MCVDGSGVCADVATGGAGPRQGLFFALKRTHLRVCVCACMHACVCVQVDDRRADAVLRSGRCFDAVQQARLDSMGRFPFTMQRASTFY